MNNSKMRINFNRHASYLFKIIRKDKYVFIVFFNPGNNISEECLKIAGIYGLDTHGDNAVREIRQFCKDYNGRQKSIEIEGLKLYIPEKQLLFHQLPVRYQTKIKQHYNYAFIENHSLLLCDKFYI